MRYEELLTGNGFRVTKGRIALLTLLSKTSRPLTVSEIEKKIKLDRVTLYRALQDFVRAKIAAQVFLSKDAMHYEIVRHRDHHHHIVCEQCEMVEDIENCGNLALENKALSTSQRFSAVTSHTLEFFGICKECEKKS